MIRPLASRRMIRLNKRRYNGVMAKQYLPIYSANGVVLRPLTEARKNDAKQNSQNPEIRILAVLF